MAPAEGQSKDDETGVTHLERRGGRWATVKGHAHDYIVEQDGRWARCTKCPRRIQYDPTPIIVRFSAPAAGKTRRARRYGTGGRIRLTQAAAGHR
jgi:hypothetical protein